MINMRVINFILTKEGITCYKINLAGSKNFTKGEGMKLGVFVSDFALTTDTLERFKADKLGIILVQNGVYHATTKENGKASSLLDKTPNLYALSEDIQIRGMKDADVDKRVKVVNYGDVVDLIFNEYDKIAWL